MLLPEEDALFAETTARKQLLQPYEASLKRFEYRQALMQGLATENPEIILALIEELVERGALERALASHSE